MSLSDAQPIVLPRNGMTFAEFRQAKPGILPDTILYNDSVALVEKLYQIEGQWVFNFRDGRLSRINFMNIEHVHSEASFKSWFSSAKIVIEDFTRSFGRPATQVQGEASYFDPSQPKLTNPAQRRHVYQEAIWSINGTEIRIIFEFKSSRADDAPETVYSDDAYEYWNYDFQVDIDNYAIPTENAPMIYGKYSLGMPVDSFATRFPALFPNGTAPSGFWGHRQDWQGLQGEWIYSFVHGKLIQFQYGAHFQNEQVNEGSFQTCKKATLGIIEELKRRYGKPNQEDVSTIGFKIPNRKKNTYHHDVTAQWNAAEGMRIVLEFSRFYGGADYEALMVSVQLTDKVFAGYE